VLSVQIAAAQQAPATPTQLPWTYPTNGSPEAWGDIAPQYALCATGLAQSPIDVPTTTPTEPHDLKFDYQPTLLTVENTPYSIKVDIENGGGITYEGTAYTLKEFSFHMPAEHTVKGRNYAMELQLIHEDADGNPAIVSVFFQQQGGDALPLIPLWRLVRAMPPERRSVVGLDINAANFLPKDRSYFSYTGSLTTPPCTENVRWILMRVPLTMSQQQVTQFQNYYAASARQVQPLNDRDVTLHSDTPAG
jgi:carbonic anhydrase